MHKEDGLKRHTLTGRVAKQRQVLGSNPMELGQLADRLVFKVVGAWRNRHPGLC